LEMVVSFERGCETGFGKQEWQETRRFVRGHETLLSDACLTCHRMGH